LQKVQMPFDVSLAAVFVAIFSLHPIDVTLF